MDDEARRQLRHDLRSPLVVIAGFAQLLQSERELELSDRRDYAERILRAARELEGLIDERL
ncbi:MAG: His Kinase (phospho-acceptor) domain [Solirubrobacteraceae bacterium]|jgi:signal transduction histidine kinase|nr:His Kinase (phospho-acceptor) domain [Solirubrobacteraceae bacterium]